MLDSITSLTQYELSQEESDLLKASLYFSIQPEKIRKFEIFTTFEKIHPSFLNNLKSKDFYKYNPSLRILSQHRISQKPQKK